MLILISTTGIGFDRRGAYLLPNGIFGTNAIIFRVDMSFVCSCW